MIGADGFRGCQPNYETWRATQDDVSDLFKEQEIIMGKHGSNGYQDYSPISEKPTPNNHVASGCTGQVERQANGFAGRIDDNLSGRVTTAKLRGLVVHQEFRCALSGRKLTPSNTQADHIKPACDGGSDDMSNVQLLRTEVNQAKGAMSQEEFVAMCCDVADRTRRGE